MRFRSKNSSPLFAQLIAWVMIYAFSATSLAPLASADCGYGSDGGTGQIEKLGKDIDQVRKNINHEDCDYAAQIYVNEASRCTEMLRANWARGVVFPDDLGDRVWSCYKKVYDKNPDGGSKGAALKAYEGALKQFYKKMDENLARITMRVSSAPNPREALEALSQQDKHFLNRMNELRKNNDRAAHRSPRGSIQKELLDRGKALQQKIAAQLKVKGPQAMSSIGITQSPSGAMSVSQAFFPKALKPGSPQNKFIMGLYGKSQGARVIAQINKIIHAGNGGVQALVMGDTVLVPGKSADGSKKERVWTMSLAEWKRNVQQDMAALKPRLNALMHAADEYRKDNWGNFTAAFGATRFGIGDFSFTFGGDGESGTAKDIAKSQYYVQKTINDLRYKLGVGGKDMQVLSTGVRNADNYVGQQASKVASFFEKLENAAHGVRDAAAIAFVAVATGGAAAVPLVAAGATGVGISVVLDTTISVGTWIGTHPNKSHGCGLGDAFFDGVTEGLAGAPTDMVMGMAMVGGIKIAGKVGAKVLPKVAPGLLKLSEAGIGRGSKILPKVATSIEKALVESGGNIEKAGAMMGEKALGQALLAYGAANSVKMLPGTVAAIQKVTAQWQACQAMETDSEDQLACQEKLQEAAHEMGVELGGVAMGFMPVILHKVISAKAEKLAASGETGGGTHEGGTTERAPPPREYAPKLDADGNPVKRTPLQRVADHYKMLKTTDLQGNFVGDRPTRAFRAAHEAGELTKGNNQFISILEDGKTDRSHARVVRVDEVDGAKVVVAEVIDPKTGAKTERVITATEFDSAKLDRGSKKAFAENKKPAKAKKLPDEDETAPVSVAGNTGGGGGGGGTGGPKPVAILGGPADAPTLKTPTAVIRTVSPEFLDGGKKFVASDGSVYTITEKGGTPPTTTGNKAAPGAPPLKVTTADGQVIELKINGLPAGESPLAKLGKKAALTPDEVKLPTSDDPTVPKRKPANPETAVIRELAGDLDTTYSEVKKFKKKNAGSIKAPEDEMKAQIEKGSRLADDYDALADLAKDPQMQKSFRAKATEVRGMVSDVNKQLAQSQIPVSIPDKYLKKPKQPVADTGTPTTDPAAAKPEVKAEVKTPPPSDEKVIPQSTPAEVREFKEGLRGGNSTATAADIEGQAARARQLAEQMDRDAAAAHNNGQRRRFEKEAENMRRTAETLDRFAKNRKDPAAPKPGDLPVTNAPTSETPTTTQPAGANPTVVKGDPVLDTSFTEVKKFRDGNRGSIKAPPEDMVAKIDQASQVAASYDDLAANTTDPQLKASYQRKAADARQIASDITRQAATAELPTEIPAKLKGKSTELAPVDPQDTKPGAGTVPKGNPPAAAVENGPASRSGATFEEIQRIKEANKAGKGSTSPEDLEASAARARELAKQADADAAATQNKSKSKGLKSDAEKMRATAEVLDRQAKERRKQMGASGQTPEKLPETVAPELKADLQTLNDAAHADVSEGTKLLADLNAKVRPEINKLSVLFDPEDAPKFPEERAKIDDLYRRVNERLKAYENLEAKNLGITPGTKDYGFLPPEQVAERDRLFKLRHDLDFFRDRMAPAEVPAGAGVTPEVRPVVKAPETKVGSTENPVDQHITPTDQGKPQTGTAATQSGPSFQEIQKVKEANKGGRGTATADELDAAAARASTLADQAAADAAATPNKTKAKSLRADADQMRATAETLKNFAKQRRGAETATPPKPLDASSTTVAPIPEVEKIPAVVVATPPVDVPVKAQPAKKLAVELQPAPSLDPSYDQFRQNYQAGEFKGDSKYISVTTTVDGKPLRRNARVVGYEDSPAGQKLIVDVYDKDTRTFVRKKLDVTELQSARQSPQAKAELKSLVADRGGVKSIKEVNSDAKANAAARELAKGASDLEIRAHQEADPTKAAQLQGQADAQRVKAAEKVLGRPLTDAEAKGIIEVHKIGLDFENPGRPLTPREIAAKVDALKKLGITDPAVRRKLIENYVAGLDPEATAGAGKTPVVVAPEDLPAFLRPKVTDPKPAAFDIKPQEGLLDTANQFRDSYQKQDFTNDSKYISLSVDGKIPRSLGRVVGFEDSGAGKQLVVDVYDPQKKTYTRKTLTEDEVKSARTSEPARDRLAGKDLKQQAEFPKKVDAPKTPRTGVLGKIVDRFQALGKKNIFGKDLPEKLDNQTRDFRDAYERDAFDGKSRFISIKDPAGGKKRIYAKVIDTADVDGVRVVLTEVYDPVTKTKSERYLTPEDLQSAKLDGGAKKVLPDPKVEKEPKSKDRDKKGSGAGETDSDTGGDKDGGVGKAPKVPQVPDQQSGDPTAQPKKGFFDRFKKDNDTTPIEKLKVVQGKGTDEEIARAWLEDQEKKAADQRRKDYAAGANVGFFGPDEQPITESQIKDVLGIPGWQKMSSKDLQKALADKAEADFKAREAALPKVDPLTPRADPKDATPVASNALPTDDTAAPVGTVLVPKPTGVLAKVWAGFKKLGTTTVTGKPVREKVAPERQKFLDAYQKGEFKEKETYLSIVPEGAVKGKRTSAQIVQLSQVEGVNLVLADVLNPQTGLIERRYLSPEEFSSAQVYGGAKRILKKSANQVAPTVIDAPEIPSVDQRTTVYTKPLSEKPAYAPKTKSREQDVRLFRKAYADKDFSGDAQYISVILDGNTERGTAHVQGLEKRNGLLYVVADVYDPHTNTTTRRVLSATELETARQSANAKSDFGFKAAPKDAKAPAATPKSVARDVGKIFKDAPSATGPGATGSFSKQLTDNTGKRVVVQYRYADREYARAQGRIFENVSPKELPRGKNYSYIVLQDGSMVFGEVQDGWEFGVKHAHLANGRAVVAAGELHVGGDGKYDFNILSGTYSMDLIRSGATTEPVLQSQMSQAFKAGFGTDGTYTTRGILPTQPPTEAEIKVLCGSPFFKTNNPSICN